MELIGLAVKSIFVENFVLAYFLGMCSFLAVSKRVETAVGLGAAVIFVMVITVPTNWAINYFLLSPDTGFFGVDLEFLQFITFIATIAAMVQLVEMFIDRFSPALYNSLGIFLPLIAVNCAILGASLFMVERDYNLAQSAVFGLSGGIGFALAIAALAAIRYKLRYAHIPGALRGLGIAMLMTGLMSVAFMAFAGIQF